MHCIRPTMDIQTRLCVLLVVCLAAEPLVNCAATEDNEMREIAKGLLAAISKRDDIKIEKRDSCNKDLDATSEPQSFSTPRGDNGKYPRFSSCKWVLTAPEGQVVQLHFTDFKLEKRIRGWIFGDYCGDAVEIYDGGDDDAAKIGEYCGEETPPDVTSSGNKLYITFSSDFNKQERGFDATFFSTEAPFKPSMEKMRCSDNNCDKEKWGYVEVRSGCHMFWWLYYTTHSDGYQNRPWIIWLQGGPGLSGTALGNFLEIGLLDKNMNPHNETWVQEANVMFVDNPVGVGYSYPENETLLASGIEAISDDLVIFLQIFLQEHPNFRTMPLFLFGQSYGGKYVTHLGYKLEQLKQSGDIDINLQGIGIGNGFVSPTDFAVNYGEFLYQAGVIDDRTRDDYTYKTKEYVQLTQEDKWPEALDKLWDMLGFLFASAPGLDFYNILEYHPQPEKDSNNTRSLSSSGSISSRDRIRFSIYDINMEPIMNGPVREKLGIIPEDKEWGEYAVYEAQVGDFVKDTIFAVDWLLQNSDVQISIYEGQLDLACQTSGAVAWVNRLTWDGLQKFRDAERRALFDPVTRKTETFVKSYQTLKFYWNLNSGHTVPTDVPEAALRMLRRILNNDDR